MKESKLIKVLLLVLSLAFGASIGWYYWSVDTLSGIMYLPTFMIVVSFGYVLTQVLKRALTRSKNWWDWLYYIGLLGIVLPTFFATEDNQHLFHWLTDIGSLFLIIPILLDGNQLIKNSSK